MHPKNLSILLHYPGNIMFYSLLKCALWKSQTFPLKLVSQRVVAMITDRVKTENHKVESNTDEYVFH